jgi:hypothetical protein
LGRESAKEPKNTEILPIPVQQHSIKLLGFAQLIRPMEGECSVQDLGISRGTHLTKLVC